MAFRSGVLEGGVHLHLGRSIPFGWRRVVISFLAIKEEF